VSVDLTAFVDVDLERALARVAVGVGRIPLA
jgi:hypothetical protein